MRGFSAIGICLVGIVGSTLVACGDGETRLARSLSGAGGEDSEGGVAGTSGVAGGNTLGGRDTGGSAGAAGSAGVATAGAGQAGVAGGGFGGSGGQAGEAAAGTPNAGQAGSSVAGGGASAGQGGVITAGAGTAGAGTGTVLLPCTASIVLPTAGKTLTEADDASGDLCADGVFYDVIVATNAPNGTVANLTVGTDAPIQTTVQGSIARFPLAPLGKDVTRNLSVAIAANAVTDACGATQPITVACNGDMLCNITSPTFTPTHVALNGVSAAQGGDRVSSEGSPYQAAFEVTTEIEDGQPVSLTVSNGTATSTLFAVAVSGKAQFPGVTFAADGNYTATASCQARSGLKATSAALTVPVDTTGPNLVVTKGTGAGAATSSSLNDGDHFGPADDADAAAGLQLKICGATTASDALDLGASVFGTAANNFCVSTGGNAPLCSPALASTNSGACVNLPCPGNGPFDLTVVLKDKAQNSNPASPAPLKRTWTNVTCAASNPTVTFVDPVADTTFTDPSLRILANGNSSAARRDKNATLAGAQYDVVACTSAPPGSSAVLRVGRESESLSQIATTTVAAATGVCPVGSQGLITFADVTIPESLTDANFQLSHPTQLAIEVTDLNFGNTTATANVWVDSISPTLTLNAPVGFCGSYIANSATVQRNLTFGTPVASASNPVRLVVVNPDSTQTTRDGTTLTFSQSTINNVPFVVGTSTVTATVTEPSGNIGVLAGPCTVQVGSNPPPTVTWVTPTAANDLGAVGNTLSGIIADADGATPGWQGELRACTGLTGAAAAGMTVTFAANGTPIGTALNIDQTTGCVSLNPATVPEGAAVQLTATTSAGATAPGSTSISLTVDATAPAAPTELAVTIPDRRQSRFHLAWRAGADGSGVAAGYDVRVARSSTAITPATFASAEAVAYTGTPAAAGQMDGIDVRDRYIENDYHFAVRAYDAVGNVSPILATSSPTRAQFIVQTIPAVNAAQNFGWVVDGSGDLNGDGFSDLLVTYSNGLEVYVFFGSASGVTTTPSVRIQGTVGQTGYAAAVIGDVNGDKIDDMAVGVFRDGDGKVLVYYGRRTWPSAALTPTNANSVITVDRNLDPNYIGANLGSNIGRIGDFNGDEIDDFALGMPSYNSGARQGQIAIIPGKLNGIPSSIVLPTAFGVSATRINGDTAIRGALGTSIVGLGRFGGTTSPVGFVAAASTANVTAGNLAGRLYAFPGVTGVPAQIQLTSAFATVDGAAANQLLGALGASLLADVGTANLTGIAVQVPNYQSPGRVALFSGTSSTGPFAQSGQLATAETPSAASSFGALILGGAIPGKATPLSFIGTTRSDFIVSTRVGSGPRLFIVDGTKYTLANVVNAESIADAVVTMPTEFTNFGRNAAPMRDLDGDGYADFAIGDVTYSGSIDGRVLVYR